MKDFNSALFIRGRLNDIDNDLNVIANIGHSGSIMPFKDEVVLKYKQLFVRKLQAIFETSNADDFRDNLINLLQENWELVKHNMCTYTALPRDDLTLLLCDIAELLAEQAKEINKHTAQPAIAYLMPSVQTESYSDQFADLTEIALEEVLRTHIISHSGYYLIPVRILVTPADTEQPNRNPYYNYEIDTNEVEYTQEELSRLKQHSKETRALLEIQKELIAFERNENGLLGQLWKLQQALFFNSVKIEGQETDAGNDAYPAIQRFSEYWQLFNEDSKKEIPAPVLEEIELLVTLGSPSESKETNEQRNHVRNISSCMAIRSQRLRTALTDHRDQLAQIQPGQAFIKRRIEALQGERKRAEKILSDRFNERPLRYDGQDLTGATLQLLEILGVKLRIGDYRLLLEFIKSASSEEIEVLRNASEASDVFTCNCRISFDGLISLLSLVEEEKYRALIPLIKGGSIIQTVGDFRTLLSMFSSEQVKAICDGMKEEMLRIISGKEDFKILVEYLNVAQIKAVCESMEEAMPRIIRTAEDFRVVLEDLPTEKMKALCESVKDQFSRIFRTISEFRAVLEALSEKKIRAMYEGMGEEFLLIIRTVDDLETILRYLPTEKIKVICESMDGVFLGIIKTAYAFGTVARHLSPEKIKIICESMKAQLLGIVGTADDFVTVLEYFSSRQKKTLCVGMKEQLPVVIRTTRNFAKVLAYLDYNSIKIVCEGMQTQLPNIIKTVEDLKLVLEFLITEQIAAFFEGIKEQLLSIVWTAENLRVILKAIPLDQIEAFCKSSQEVFLKIIKTCKDFREVLTVLAPERIKVVCKGIKDQLSKLIRNASAFNDILNGLAPKQKAAIYKEIKEQLTDFIEDRRDLITVFGCLMPEQIIEVCEDIKKRLPEIINDAEGLKEVLGAGSLSTEQMEGVCEGIKEKLPNIGNMLCSITESVH